MTAPRKPRGATCECPVRCRFCGARLRKDFAGHYCPTPNCQWAQTGSGTGCTSYRPAPRKPPRATLTVVLTPGERQITCRALVLGLQMGWLISDTDRGNATSAESAIRRARVAKPAKTGKEK